MVNRSDQMMLSVNHLKQPSKKNSSSRGLSRLKSHNESVRFTDLNLVSFGRNAEEEFENSVGFCTTIRGEINHNNMQHNDDDCGDIDNQSISKESNTLA